MRSEILAITYTIPIEQCSMVISPPRVEAHYTFVMTQHEVLLAAATLNIASAAQSSLRRSLGQATSCRLYDCLASKGMLRLVDAQFIMRTVYPIEDDSSIAWRLAFYMKLVAFHECIHEYPSNNHYHALLLKPDPWAFASSCDHGLSSAMTC